MCIQRHWADWPPSILSRPAIHCTPGSGLAHKQQPRQVLHITNSAYRSAQVTGYEVQKLFAEPEPIEALYREDTGRHTSNRFRKVLGMLCIGCKACTLPLCRCSCCGTYMQAGRTPGIVFSLPGNASKLITLDSNTASNMVNSYDTLQLSHKLQQSQWECWINSCWLSIGQNTWQTRFGCTAVSH